MAKRKAAHSETERPKTHAEDPLLTCSEAGALIGRHGTTIKRWMVEGLLPFVKDPTGLLRVRRSRLESFLRETTFEIKD